MAEVPADQCTYCTPVPMPSMSPLVVCYPQTMWFPTPQNGPRDLEGTFPRAEPHQRTKNADKSVFIWCWAFFVWLNRLFHRSAHVALIGTVYLTYWYRYRYEWTLYIYHYCQLMNAHHVVLISSQLSQIYRERERDGKNCPWIWYPWVTNLGNSTCG